MKKKKYWYMFYYYECPVCWRGGIRKERQYGKCPKKYASRHKFVSYYDGCM